MVCSLFKNFSIFSHTLSVKITYPLQKMLTMNLQRVVCIKC